MRGSNWISLPPPSDVSTLGTTEELPTECGTAAEESMATARHGIH